MAKINTKGLKEHSFQTLRRDYTTEQCCAFCPNKLTTGTALFLSHPELGEVAAGPVCGARWGDRPARTVPDYTGFGFVESDEAEEIGSQTASRSPSPEDRVRKNRDHLWAEEYLMLRYEKLPGLGFTRLGHNNLLPGYYEAMRSGDLSPEMIVHIKRINAALQSDPVEEYRKFSYEGLMLSYTYAHWLEQCISRGPTKLRPANFTRLLDFKKQLLKKKTLSGKQILALNFDLRVVFGEHAPVLEPSSFDAYRPDHLRFQRQPSLER